MADDLKSSFKKERRCNMTDSKELRSLIEEKGFKLKYVAEYLGLSSYGLSLKIDNNRDLYWHFPAYLQSYKKSGKEWRATPYSSIRSGDWKLIYYYEDKSVELFNLKDDLKSSK